MAPRKPRSYVKAPHREGLYNTREAAAALGLQPDTLWSRQQNRTVGQRIGPAWYFTAADLIVLGTRLPRGGRRGPRPRKPGSLADRARTVGISVSTLRYYLPRIVAAGIDPQDVAALQEWFATTTIPVRVPAALLQLIDQECRIAGQSRPEFILAAVRHHIAAIYEANI